MAEPTAIPVRASAGDYQVLVGPGALTGLGARLRSLGLARRFALITDANVERSWGARVKAELGPDAAVAVFPGGESSKTLSQVESLCRWLARERFTRQDAVIALGGGVTGDLAGFVAASFHRGMGLVQVPTSLLAQVDSSIGGKVAVDLPEGKNLVGAFYAPRLVVADTDTLATLPERERWNGLAEVVKAGLIRDVTLLEQLERELEGIAAGRADPAQLAEIVRAAVRIKAEVVSADEREGGLRMILNFGHTLGHALESTTGYGPLLHGEAVVLGMRAAVALSVELAGLSPDDAARADRLLARMPVPSRLGAIDREEIVAALGRDKKGTRFILLEALGRARIVDAVPLARLEPHIDQALARLK